MYVVYTSSGDVVKIDTHWIEHMPMFIFLCPTMCRKSWHLRQFYLVWLLTMFISSEDVFHFYLHEPWTCCGCCSNKIRDFALQFRFEIFQLSFLLCCSHITARRTSARSLLVCFQRHIVVCTACLLQLCQTNQVFAFFKT